MKKVWRHLLVVFVMCIVSSFCFVTTAAAETYSGTIEGGFTWTLDSGTGVLTISGEGTIGDYIGISPYDYYTFSDYAKLIKHVVFSDGITEVSMEPMTHLEVQTFTLGKDIHEFRGGSCHEKFIVDARNPYFAVYDNSLYSKNFDTLYMVPYGKEVWKLHDNLKDLEAGRPVLAYEISPSNQTYTVYDDVLYSKDLVTLYSVPSRKQGFKFPEETRVIESGALSNTYGMPAIIIPEGVTTWKDGAFSDPGVAVLPNSMVEFEPPEVVSHEDVTILQRDTFVIFSTENKAAAEFFGDIPQAISVSPELHQLYASGKAKGWQTVNGHTYYFDASGFPGGNWGRGGWQEIEGYWYYFDPDTYILQTGFQRINGKAYYLGTTGAREHDKWKLINGDWYYLNSYGAGVVKIWLKSGGKWYFMQADGSMAKSRWVEWYHKWYYVGSDGAMYANRWIKSSGKWYYLGADGMMYTNRYTPDGYWVNADGVWVP